MRATNVTPVSTCITQGSQYVTPRECKFWHSRRMAFIHCSLSGTALSWYIRLNYTLQTRLVCVCTNLKKTYQMNALFAQVEALALFKKDNATVRHFALKFQKIVQKAGVMK